MAMDYFCCYNSYRESIANLSDQEVGRLFKGLMKWNETGEPPEFKGRESLAFCFIRSDIERDRKRYEDQQAEEAARRAAKVAGGSKGGKAKASNARKNVAKPSSARKRVAQLENAHDSSSSSSSSSIDNPLSLCSSDLNCNRQEDYQKITTTTTAIDTDNAETLGACVQHYEKFIGTNIPPMVRDNLAFYTERLPTDVICHAIDVAAAENRHTWSYVKGILAQYVDGHVHNMADVARHEEQFRKRGGARNAQNSRGVDPGAPTLSEQHPEWNYGVFI